MEFSRGYSYWTFEVVIVFFKANNIQYDLSFFGGQMSIPWLNKQVLANDLIQLSV